MFSSILNGKKTMLKKIHSLLDECDAVIHYNGTRFDIPTLNKEFLEAGMPPPSPYHQIDLLKTSRKEFRFPSNKLDYVARALGLGQKTKHEGFELWIKSV
jgi:DNA polymerase III epsilon subunit-like protein